MSALTTPFNIMLETVVQKKIKPQRLTDWKGRNKTISVGRCYNCLCKKLRNLQKRTTRATKQIRINLSQNLSQNTSSTHKNQSHFYILTTDTQRPKFTALSHS